MDRGVAQEQLWLPLYYAECFVTPMPTVSLDDLVVTLRKGGILVRREGSDVIAEFEYSCRRSFAQGSDAVFRTPGVARLDYARETQETYLWLAGLEERRRIAEIKAFRGDQD